MKQCAWMVAAAALALERSPPSLPSPSVKALPTRAPTPAETYVLEVGNELVSLADFTHVYGKNNRDSVYTVEALDEYMELFVNFKLKVLEAEALGMDTAAAFQKELAGYRTQLARPYLVDGALLDELVEQAFERKGMEVRASHMLISVDANAAPADTLRAWNASKRCAAVSSTERILKPWHEAKGAVKTLGDEQRWRPRMVHRIPNGLPSKTPPSTPPKAK